MTAMWGAGVLAEARAEPLLEALEPAALFALAMDATGRITFSNGRARELLSRQEGDEVVDHLRRHLAALGIRTATAQKHVATLLRRLGVPNRAAAVGLLWKDEAQSPT